MTPVRTLIAIGLILAAVGTAAQTAAPVSLALIRPDGILVPFAVFDGTSWVEAWPEPSKDRAIDRMIEMSPSYWRQRRTQMPQTWHVARAGRAQTKVNVLTHVIFDEHCENQVGVLTDLTPRRADAHDKLLASDRPVSMAMPATIEGSAGAWSDLLTRALQEVARQETAAIASEEEHVGRRSELEPASERARIRLRRVFGHRDAGSRTLYYEAERSYKKPIFSAPRAEPSVLVAAGWIHAQDGSPAAVLNRRAVITGPNFKEALTITPLAILNLNDAASWVVIEHGYESEAVSVIQVKTAGIGRVFNKYIGGC